VDAAAPKSCEGTAGTTKRLVVVADNSLIIEAIQIGLRRSGGFTILGRTDGRSTSLRTVLDARPDVVLVDDMQGSARAMPLIRDFRAADEQLAIILLTVRMDHEWLDQAFEAGATGAISKLVHPVALGTLIRETVNGNVVHPSPCGRPQLATVPDCPLTARELEILRLAAGGSTNGEIARELWVTQQTVKFHLSNLYRKLGVANRTEASHYAHFHRLVEAPPHGSASAPDNQELAERRHVRALQAG
jgi:DNA-binding NarL/FixJ family response regulator